MSDESKDLLKFLESGDNKFYFPDNSLSREIVRAIETELEHDLRKLDHQISEAELSEIPFQQIIKETGSGELIDEENLLGFQRRLAKEIYFYLDFLSRHVNQGASDKLFNSVFSYEMGKILGLPKKHVSINNLTQSFIKWIRGKVSFQAGWGIIRWDDQKQIILQSFTQRAMAANGTEHDKTVSFPVEVED